MTFRELYLHAKRQLTAAGVDSPGFDAAALTERFFGLDRTGLALHGTDSPSPSLEAAFQKAVAERSARRPLQYILGSWEFMGLSLKVGEGVLAPREDTAVLVEATAAALKGRSAPKGLDLCAGTGAVALGLCSLLPNARVRCVEHDEIAFSYLQENIAAYPQYRIEGEQADILLPETAAEFSPKSLDFIAANPPYVRTADIASLQPEVQKEPAAALDGGLDGLLFYRAIAEFWTPLLKPGGVLAVETGEDQGPAVKDIFSAQGLTDLKILRDWSALDRVVTAKTPS